MIILKKYWKIILFLIITVVSVIYLYDWAKDNIPTQADLCKQGVKLYKNYSVQGRVIKKFINKENHNDKTIIIKEKYNQENILILDADIGGIYDYIVVGDSVVKNNGELFVLVNRNGNDTIIDFKFRCY
jgi:hypothetical protein